MDRELLAAGLGFLGGVILLGIMTALVVLIDIRVELTQSTRRQRRGRPEPDEFNTGLTWESRKRKQGGGGDDA